MTALGYRNSDFLFSDRLIFVEGPSDQATLPVILRKLNKIEPAAVESIGFPIVRGVPGAGKPGSGKKNVASLQNSINRCEEFMMQMSRQAVPHSYLFDGDFQQEEKQQLEATAGGTLQIRFLARKELENYLLEPKALARVIKGEMDLFGILQPSPTPEEIESLVWKLLGKTPDNASLSELSAGIKGSEILTGLFDTFTLPYDKIRHAKLIAEFIEDPGKADWEEIWFTLSDCLQ